MSSISAMPVSVEPGVENTSPEVTEADPKGADNSAMETDLDLSKVIELEVPRAGDSNTDTMTVFPLNVTVPSNDNTFQRIYVVRKVKPVHLIPNTSVCDNSAPVTQLAGVEEVCVITKGSNDVETIINEAQKAMDAKNLNERINIAIDSTEKIKDNDKKMVTTADASTLTTDYFIVESVDKTQRLKKKVLQECSICNQLFRNLNSHMLTHKNEKKHQCSLCDKAFVHQSNMKRHMRTHLGIKAFTCVICSKAFYQSEHLKYHLKTHTGEKLFHCQVCGQSFSRGSILKTHMRSHTGEKPYQCRICHKMFASCSNMRDHEVVHTGNKPFACSICPKRFCRPCQLRDHMHKHSGEKPFVCNCGKRFPMKRALLMHAMRVHGPKEEGDEYKCTICDKIMATAITLKQHIKIHSTVRPYACSLCTKSFNQKSHLIRHEESHLRADKKPFICTMCPKMFRMAATLEKHLKKHINEISISNSDIQLVIQETQKKVYSCGECDKSFAKPRGLYKHMCIHLGYRPFQCGECGSCYAQADKLLQHIRDHS